MMRQRGTGWRWAHCSGWALLVCAAAGLASGTAERAGRAGRRSAPPAVEPREMTLDLEHADLRTVLLYLAEVTGKAVVPAPGLSGEISVRSAGAVSTGEVARLLVAALATNGFHVTDDGACLRVARADNAPMSTVQATVPESGDEERFMLQLDEVDVRSVVGLLAELTGKTLLPAAGMSGRVTVISPQPVTRREAVEILYAVLETHGYTVVEYGTYAKIVRAQDAAGKPIRLQAPRTAPGSVKEQ